MKFPGAPDAQCLQGMPYFPEKFTGAQMPNVCKGMPYSQVKFTGELDAYNTYLHIYHHQAYITYLHIYHHQAYITYLHMVSLVLVYVYIIYRPLKEAVLVIYTSAFSLRKHRLIQPLQEVYIIILHIHLNVRSCRVGCTLSN